MPNLRSQNEWHRRDFLLCTHLAFKQRFNLWKLRSSQVKYNVWATCKPDDPYTAATFTVFGNLRPSLVRNISPNMI